MHTVTKSGAAPRAAVEGGAVRGRTSRAHRYTGQELVRLLAATRGASHPGEPRRAPPPRPGCSRPRAALDGAITPLEPGAPEAGSGSGVSGRCPIGCGRDRSTLIDEGVVSSTCRGPSAARPGGARALVSRDQSAAAGRGVWTDRTTSARRAKSHVVRIRVVSNRGALPLVPLPPRASWRRMRT